MKPQKDEKGFLNGLDPAVEELIGRGNRRQAERNLSRDGRKSVKREREKAEARKGKRALYDLPPELIERVRKIAEAYEVSNSQVAKLAIWLFLDDVRNARVNVKDYRVLGNKNPKNPYTIELPNDEDFS
jgi:hypothetical protein